MNNNKFGIIKFNDKWTSQDIWHFDSQQDRDRALKVMREIKEDNRFTCEFLSLDIINKKSYMRFDEYIKKRYGNRFRYFKKNGTKYMKIFNN
jgi:hypothetical protein